MSEGNSSSKENENSEKLFEAVWYNSEDRLECYCLGPVGVCKQNL